MSKAPFIFTRQQVHMHLMHGGGKGCKINDLVFTFEKPNIKSTICLNFCGVMIMVLAIAILLSTVYYP